MFFEFCYQSLVANGFGHVVIFERLVNKQGADLNSFAVQGLPQPLNTKDKAAPISGRILVISCIKSCFVVILNDNVMIIRYIFCFGSLHCFHFSAKVPQFCIIFKLLIVYNKVLRYLRNENVAY